ncbi:MAG: ABC transporter permease [Chloroflexota bacterium]|jgi:general nucleoside transport system permease protein
MTTAPTPSDKEQNDQVLSLLRRIWRGISVPLVAVLLALLIGAIILLISGANPIQAYQALVQGSFGSPVAIQRTLEKATPLIFSGLAVAFAFKAGLFNIGAQGQLLVGASVAAFIGFAVTGLPPIIHAPLALLMGGLAGALYGAIPGALKVYTGAHEVIVTIMLNYIAINLTDFLADGPWKDPAPGNIVARTPPILASAQLPIIGNIPLGFIFAIVAAVIVWWLLFRTTLGYEIRTVGLNSSAAQYAGIQVAKIIVLTMMISGFLAGFGGGVQTLGIVGRFQPGFNTGLGFEGITVALLGKTHPLGVIPAALLLGAMSAGSNLMQFNAGVPNQITDVITAFILFFVAADVIVKRLLRQRVVDDEKITLSSGWGSH